MESSRLLLKSLVVLRDLLDFLRFDLLSLLLLNLVVEFLLSFLLLRPVARFHLSLVYLFPPCYRYSLHFRIEEYHHYFQKSVALNS